MTRRKTLFVNTGEGHLQSLLIILLQSELVTVFTIDNFESMIITPCGKRSNVLLRSFQSTLHKIIFKAYKIMTSLLLPYSNNMAPFPVESLLLWYHFFVLMMSSDIHKNPGPMVDPNKNIILDFYHLVTGI